jgi:hypothetical protein
MIRRAAELGPVARTDLLVVPGSYNVGVDGVTRAGNRLPSASVNVKLEVAPATVQIVRVDVEKLVNWGHGRGSPPRPGRPPRAIPGTDSEDKAITVVEPTTKGS